MNQQEAFLELLIAAMSDAAVSGSLTQLKTTIDPDGKGVHIIRLIVVPEKMAFEFPKPLASRESQ